MHIVSHTRLSIYLLAITTVLNDDKCYNKFSQINYDKLKLENLFREKKPQLINSSLYNILTV